MIKVIKKVLIWAVYSAVSMVWLFFAIVFVSPIMYDDLGSKDWEEDAMFIPIGIIMLIIWLFVLIFMILRVKKKSKYDSINNCCN